MVLTFESVDEILKYDPLNENYCNEQYVPVALFVVMRQRKKSSNISSGHYWNEWLKNYRYMCK